MKPVLVTGATRGLGLAIVEKLAQSGEYRIIGCGRNPSDGLMELVEKFQGDSRVIFRHLDLNKIEEIHSFVNDITGEYGALFGLVNNAAIGHDGILATMHERDIGELIRVNLEAPILLSKYACRSMLTRMEGRIIQVSSIIASTGFKGLAVYGATKAGLLGLTKSMAREVGRAGITVNAVLPGYMETDMTAGLDSEKLASIKRRSPSGRLADVADVAAAVCFLMSAEAKSINGSSITVDAGSTA